MKVSLSWLKEYIPVEMETDELVAGLTMAGLEVDAVTNRYDHLEGVVISRIVEIAPHPNADKLNLCQVDVGDKIISVVCGAPNAAKDLVVPCALPGTIFPDGMKIKKGKLRGEKSEGMLCSAFELGLSNDRDGIMALDSECKPGMPLSEALNLEDVTIEVDLTPNRPDCLSLIGTAREIGALEGHKHKVKYPDVELPEVSSSYKNIEEYTSVSLIDKDLCPRYAARLIFDVKIGPSPFWLQDRLNSVGIKPINNIVDVTNFVMMETGQPLHAFDFDSLEEGRIVVRAAVEGEKFTTLDDAEHTLSSETLLICDGKKPVALAGVMGGLNSEIEDKTTRVLLESAYFDPTCIRKASKRTGLNTDAAHRFERGADPEGVIFAINRAVALMVKIADGSLVDGVIDEYPEKITSQDITMSARAINARLGTDLSIDEMSGYLEHIEFSINKIDDDTLKVTPPSFRVDVSRPEDLSEEVARLWGYNNIQTTFPAIPAEAFDLAPAIASKNLVRRSFVGLGFSEVINYSFIHKLSCDRLLLGEDDRRRKIVEVINPLSEEQSVMRTSLVPGLLSNVHYNNARQVKNLKLFEIGKIFFKTGDTSLPEEFEMLSGALTGNMIESGWYSKTVESDFYDLKGFLEGFFDELYVKNISFTPVSDVECPYMRKGYAAEIMADGEKIGMIGRVHSDVLENYEIKQDVFIFEINLFDLSPMISSERTAVLIPVYPSVTRDTTIICDNSVVVGDLLDSIDSIKEEIIEKSELLDVYTGDQIEDGKRSLSFRITYRSHKKTLKDKAVNKIHTQITNKLLEKFDAGLP